MTNPLVSVIIPAYNHASFIEEALLSVIRQTYRHLELIMIDDGSSDATADIASRLLERYMPSAVLLRRRNIGAAATINQGIQMSSGKYLNILNSDDAFQLDRIAACVEVAEIGKSDFIYTDVNFIDHLSAAVKDDAYVQELVRVDRNATRYPSLGFAFLRNQLTITTGNMFLSRDLVRKVGLFSEYKYVHDWDFVLRALYYTEPHKICSGMYDYRIHGTNSFKSLGDIAAFETTEVVRNCLSNMIERNPINKLAPSPKYWPGVFEYLIHEWQYYRYLPPRFRAAHVPWESIQ